MDTAGFFADLGRRLDDHRQANRRAVGTFFDALAPTVTHARRRQRRLDREKAHRFYALDYLQTDELGLSRIVADLLNPNATHGQGTDFLQRFLAALKESTSFVPGVDLDRCQIAVERERPAHERFIDIVVQIGHGTSRWALAIENKPYAGDQEHQIRDYLEYLAEEFGQNFLLIYLSPTGEGPSDWSVSRRELTDHWQGRFAILPYCRPESAPEPDGFEPFRVPLSLAEWLETCRDRCRIDRLHWFLDETLRFCQRAFGETTMTTDRESREIRDFLFEHPDHLEAARAVYDSWPAIHIEICRQFLARVRERIATSEVLQAAAPDLYVDSAFTGDDKTSPNAIRLCRRAWLPYRTAQSDNTAAADLRTTIFLEPNTVKGPDDWYIGICCPVPVEEMDPAESERYDKLRQALPKALGPPRGSVGRYLWWKWVDADYRNWSSLVPRLAGENREDGPIAQYFVDRFVALAARAIPVIDDIERSPST